MPAALSATATFGAGTGAGAWASLDRATVAAGIADLVNFPDHAQQGGNGLCTTAAFINVWAQDAPDAYAAFAAALFENGAADIAPAQGTGAGLTITAGEDLRNADYYAIATKMGIAGYPVPSQADWMVMSAIRDSSNDFVDFTGDPDDWVSSALGDGSGAWSGELPAWLRATGVWSTVIDDESPFFGSDLDSALLLDPAHARVILNIDAELLDPALGSGNHTCVLRSPVTKSAAGNVELRVWSWTSLYDVSVTEDKFNGDYNGATTASV